MRMHDGVSGQSANRDPGPAAAASHWGGTSAMLLTREGHPPHLLLPREHGAWAMVALPFLTGAIAASGDGRGGLNFAVLAAAIATLSIVMVRTPLSVLWRM